MGSSALAAVLVLAAASVGDPMAAMVRSTASARMDLTPTRRPSADGTPVR